MPTSTAGALGGAGASLGGQHGACKVHGAGDEVQAAGRRRGVGSGVTGVPIGPQDRALLPFLLWGRVPDPTKIDYRKKGTLILTSLLEDLVCFPFLMVSINTFLAHER